MIWLVEDFGLLSVILRAIILTLQTLVVGGIFFALLVLTRDGETASSITARTGRWIGRFSLSLAVAGALYIATDSAILSTTTGIAVQGLIGADYFLSGLIVIGLSLAIFSVTLRARLRPSPVALAALASALMIDAVFSSHAVSRMDHRVLLSVLTLLHQGAAALWMGGLAFLFLALRDAGLSFAAARAMLGRFATVAMFSVATIVGSGISLSVFYIGSAQALYGTAYGVMVIYKALLLGIIVLVGAVNFSAAREGRFAHSTITLLRRFSELELAFFLAVLLTAASLTSQPPGIDLVEGRLTASELAIHFKPAFPPLHHPPLESLAPATPLEEMLATPDNQERAAAHTNRDPDLAWSEFEHNWAGIFLVLIGTGGFISAFHWGRWARYWPLIFFVLAIFLMVFSDPENWPLGPISYWKSFSDPEVLQHRIFFSLLIVYGVFEIGVQTGRLRQRWAALVFPTMLIFGSCGMLLHSHALGNVRLELLAEISHTMIGVLGFVCGAFRWLEIWLKDDLAHSPEDRRDPRLARAVAAAARVWPICLVLIGLVLFNYREG
jgi:putative copper resistance protein D